MKLGLIGHPLGHSWSPEIHSFFIHEEYQKWDILPEDLDAFMKKRDFDGINVTIPYKQAVLPYLDEIDEMAEKIGAVNCIVNHSGRLKGYNTDALGFSSMLAAHHIDVNGKVTAVLGTGGASKAVIAVLKKLGAKTVSVSRTARENAVDYAGLYAQSEKIEVLVNTTPVGMYPESEEEPVDLKPFVHLQAVIDIIANPLRTKLVFSAGLRNIQTCTGLEMLVRQAFAADEIFTNTKLDESLISQCMHTLNQKRRSIVLIGMPTSGKTTIARLLGEKTSRQVVEMDDEIEMKMGMSISACFHQKGEQYFRNIEKETAFDVKNKPSLIVSCGGGVIKSRETMRYLGENAVVVWIRRDLSQLYATSSRPLTRDYETIIKLYEERKELYRQYSDIIIDNNGTLEEAVNTILMKTGEYVL